MGSGNSPFIKACNKDKQAKPIDNKGKTLKKILTAESTTEIHTVPERDVIAPTAIYVKITLMMVSILYSSKYFSQGLFQTPSKDAVIDFLNYSGVSMDFENVEIQEAVGKNDPPQPCKQMPHKPSSSKSQKEQ